MEFDDLALSAAVFLPVIGAIVLMAMPKANVRADVAMPSSLMPFSSSFGQNTSARTPSTGKNVATGSSQLASLMVSMGMSYVLTR